MPAVVPLLVHDASRSSTADEPPLCWSSRNPSPSTSTELLLARDWAAGRARSFLSVLMAQLKPMAGDVLLSCKCFLLVG